MHHKNQSNIVNINVNINGEQVYKPAVSEIPLKVKG
jgi:hypothetical protein